MSNSRFAPAVSPSLRFDDQYDLVAYLGGGQFGEVWKALDTTTGRTVALKLIDPSQTTPDDAWREATHLTSLTSGNSPNSTFLVAVHGARMSRLGVPYIDMALVDGSAGALARPFGVDETTAIRWVQRVARGLHLCHERRLLHRDVKPDNILLSQTGEALLGDFGVAAVMADDKTAAAHGDVHILAPEVFNGRCSVQSDVYSLGVSLFALVTGDYPRRFADHGGDWGAFASAVQTGVPAVRDIAPHLTVGVAGLIREATAIDPTNRFCTAAAFDSALASLNPPRRVIRRIAPCGGAWRCWVADPNPFESLRPVHVCVAQTSEGKFEIETRRIGGQRMTALCGVVTPGQLNTRLRAVFRSLH